MKKHPLFICAKIIIIFLMGIYLSSSIQSFYSADYLVYASDNSDEYEVKEIVKESTKKIALVPFYLLRYFVQSLSNELFIYSLSPHKGFLYLNEESQWRGISFNKIHQLVLKQSEFKSLSKELVTQLKNDSSITQISHEITFEENLDFALSFHKMNMIVKRNQDSTQSNFCYELEDTYDFVYQTYSTKDNLSLKLLQTVNNIAYYLQEKGILLPYKISIQGIIE